MIDLNSFQSINLCQFFDSVKFRSRSGYYLVVKCYKVMFYMLMMVIFMKFSFVAQNFSKVSFKKIKNISQKVGSVQLQYTI